jgi:hypothetical protein
MLSGNLCAGALRDGNLLVRIDPETSDELTVAYASLLPPK